MRQWATTSFSPIYRNGVKPWQWDPTKWLIWILSKSGITSDLRCAAPEKIVRRASGEHGLVQLTYARS
jgi:fatty-acid desaturase